MVVRYNDSMLPDEVEWPTMAVAGAIAVATAALLLAGDRLPAPLTVLGLGVVAAWYNSLQHEIIHGHPTPWAGVNRAMGSLPLLLVFPFERYRLSHLTHHRDEFLTDPAEDPESHYVEADEWDRMGAVRRGVLLAHQTLLGRVVLGPPLAATRFWCRFAATWPTDRAARRTALGHLVAVAAWLAVVVAAPIGLVEYVVGAAWAGLGISFVRSFVEHRAVTTGSPTAVVHTGWFFSLLFLHNNLHSTHHARPGLPWYRIPAAHRELDDEAASAAGAGVYAGYGEIARRFLVRPSWVPVRAAAMHGI